MTVFCLAHFQPVQFSIHLFACLEFVDIRAEASDRESCLMFCRKFVAKWGVWIHTVSDRRQEN